MSFSLKKITGLALVVAMVFAISLTGCSSDKEKSNDRTKSSLSTFTSTSSNSETITSSKISSSSATASSTSKISSSSAQVKTSSANSTNSTSASSSKTTSTQASKSNSQAIALSDSGINYNESTDIIENPGRGFYYYMSETLTKDSEKALVTTDEFNEVLNANENWSGESQYYIFLKIDISAYSAKMGGTDTDISQKSLTALKNTLDNLRASKLSATLRFTYDTEGVTYGKGDCEPASLNQILKHVEQLSAVIKNYKDCVYSIDAGMFGAWGEMHSTSYSDIYLSGTALTKVNESLYQLIDKWLVSTDGEMNIAVRRPRHYVIWYNKKYNTNYTISQIGEIPEQGFGNKISFYNDGYLNGKEDDGTYVDRNKEISWLSKRLFSSFGGETNDYKETALGKNICKEGFLTHTAYLNYFYNQEVVVSNSSKTAWKQQLYGTGMTENVDSVYQGKTYYDYIANHLGYRLVLRESKLTKQVEKGGKLVLSGKVENVGFGNLTAKKKTYLVIVGNGQTNYYLTDFDAQKTFVSGTHAFDFQLDIPQTFKTGDYKVYLKIASAYDQSQTETKRQVRFANQGAESFNEAIGANYLGAFSVVA